MAASRYRHVRMKVCQPARYGAVGSPIPVRDEGGCVDLLHLSLQPEEEIAVPGEEPLGTDRAHAAMLVVTHVGVDGDQLSVTTVSDELADELREALLLLGRRL